VKKVANNRLDLTDMLFSFYLLQLGRIVGSNLEPASSLSRQERGRNVVEELVKDAEASAYAKRKFDAVSNARLMAYIRSVSAC